MLDNNNVIYVPNITDYTEFINATKPFDPIIIDISNSSASQNLAQSRHKVYPLNIKVLGGDGLYNYQAGTCSAGFWVFDIDGGFYIITAGHCYEPGVWFHLPWGSNGPSLSIGPMVFNSLNYDVGVIFLEDHDVTPTFIIRNDEADQYEELIITDGESVSSHDVHICKSGYKTHFTCANVFGVNGILVSIDGKISYDLIITGLRSDFGDSGGPVLSFVSPQDLHLVVVHGIYIAGAGTALSIDKIFNELDKHYKNLTLYQGQTSLI
ncbi:S1 family peptidase [Gigaspora margarita]|uniref:S1 family peptidase n=1 Tax=Gigaspora margarita TaxID=4874 RepID=A0A8H4B0E6_GIGMA|nr:S1 family peptidase [Gigaspora margarita]